MELGSSPFAHSFSARSAQVSITQNGGKMKIKQCLLLVAVWLIATMFVSAQNDQFELVGRWSYGVQTEIQLVNDTAYVGSGALIIKANLEDVNHVIELAQIDLGHFIRDFVMVDQYIYAITGDTLFTVDISGGDMNIVQASSIDLASRDIFYGNDRLFVCAWERMHIYSITDRANPTFTSRIDTEDLQFRNLGFKGDYVYGSTRDDQYDSLIIVDISDPLSPSLINVFVTTDGYINFTFGMDSLLYVGSRDSLFIFSIEDPVDPQLIRTISTGWLYDCTISSGIAYFSAQGHGVRLFDVANPVDPRYITNLRGWSCEVRVHGEHAFAMCETGGPIQVHDVSDINTPELLTEILLGDRIFQLELWEDLVIISGGHLLTVLDAGDLSNIHSLSTVPVEYTEGLDMKDSIGFVANDEGFLIVNFGDGSSPVIISETNTPGRVRYIEAQENYLFLSSDRDGIRVFDVTNIETPVQTDSFMTESSFGVIELFGNLLFAWQDDFGIRVIDVSDKTNLLMVDSIPYGGRANAMFSHDSLFYFSRNGFCNVIDLTDPNFPTIESLDISCSTPVGIVIQDGIYYSAQQYNGLYLYDLDDPVQPDFIARYDDNRRIIDIEVRGDYIYISDFEAGLIILEYTGASTLSQFPNDPKAGEIRTWPDPFEDELFLELRSQVSSSGVVSIHDMNGLLVWYRKFEDFVNPQSIDLSDLPGGVYVILVKTPDRLNAKVITKMN